MNTPEVKKNNIDAAQEWNMSGIPFAGAEQESNKKEKISQALKYAPELLTHSEIFSGNGRMSNFTNTILSDRPNNEILNNIKQLDDGRYYDNYGINSTNRGFTGLGQVSGALDYFDDKYGSLIDDNNLKGLIKTSLAAWPMGNLDNFGVQEFAKSAKIDKGTADLINLLINRHSTKLADAYFNQNNHMAAEQLLQINSSYLTRIDGYDNGYIDKEAKCVCNIQKIIIDCAKNGATIAKERKAQKNKS